MDENIDNDTVQSFGDEWSRHDQSGLSNSERSEIFEQYFEIFPWHELPPDAIGLDAGCGSGRWALPVAKKVGWVHCTDASRQAIESAKISLSTVENVSFHVCGIGSLPVNDSSMDFCYSLGVLHHIPSTKKAMRKCVEKLKPGAPFLIYLYYRFDNMPVWYAQLWYFSDRVRKLVSKQSPNRKALICDVAACFVYWPLSRVALVAELVGFDVDHLPLSYYRRHSLLTMRTDARDRLGTPLEQRFTKVEISKMMTEVGLENIEFSNSRPYWCAVGRRKHE